MYTQAHKKRSSHMTVHVDAVRKREKQVGAQVVDHNGDDGGGSGCLCLLTSAAFIAIGNKIVGHPFQTIIRRKE